MLKVLDWSCISESLAEPKMWGQYQVHFTTQLLALIRQIPIGLLGILWTNGPYQAFLLLYFFNKWAKGGKAGWAIRPLFPPSRFTFDQHYPLPLCDGLP
jgi:hypothetical protein